MRVAVASRLLKRLWRHCGSPPVQFVLPGGEVIGDPSVRPVGAIRLGDYRTILQLVTDPIFQFGEAFADRRIQVDGPLVDCLTVIYRAMNQRAWDGGYRRWLDRLRRPRRNTPGRSRLNIHHHYDLGNDFYQLWLDRRMLYTCAWFPTPDVTLEQAQLAKMDLVCRKLRLQPGMRVVEAGCGWGALALHMARHYGVQVRAFNISGSQIDWARQQARQQGLEGRVEFVLDDWRNIRGSFDAFASVGMLEHVGIKNYGRLGQLIKRVLKPQGLALIHSIGQNQPLPVSTWIERRIFPGAYPPTIRQMMDIVEPGNWQVLDIENLRLHYARTLRHWLQRFENSAARVQQQFDDRFVRMWRLYLAGSAAAFESGCLQLYQMVFAPAASNHIPWTRADLYGHDSLRRGDS
jgi:cyclopropane-fatty-acyl-phospholipid synthase